MCGPMLGLMGGVMQGIAAAQQAKVQAANFKMQQLAAERDAKIIREKGAYQAARTVERGKQLIGRQVAAYSASGFDPSTGTPLETISRVGGEIGLDIAAARWGHAREIENKQYEGKIAGMNAKSAQSSVGLAFLTPIIGAGATALRSFG